MWLEANPEIAAEVDATIRSRVAFIYGPDYEMSQDGFIVPVDEQYNAEINDTMTNLQTKRVNLPDYGVWNLQQLQKKRVKLPESYLPYGDTYQQLQQKRVKLPEYGDYYQQLQQKRVKLPEYGDYYQQLMNLQGLSSTMDDERFPEIDFQLQ
jgi:hypothetical protein